MRLKSSILVSALLRQVNLSGGFGAVLNKGAEEAGAIFIAHLKSGSRMDFYGPAPQAHFDAETSGERIFECLAKDIDQPEVSKRIESQLRFDPDCWVVELETAIPIGELVKLSEAEN